MQSKKYTFCYKNKMYFDYKNFIQWHNFKSDNNVINWILEIKTNI